MWSIDLEVCYKVKQPIFKIEGGKTLKPKRAKKSLMMQIDYTK